MTEQLPSTAGGVGFQVVWALIPSDTDGIAIYRITATDAGDPRAGGAGHALLQINCRVQVIAGSRQRRIERAHG